jgi:hypothetical protein
MTRIIHGLTFVLVACADTSSPAPVRPPTRPPAMPDPDSGVHLACEDTEFGTTPGCRCAEILAGTIELGGGVHRLELDPMRAIDVSCAEHDGSVEVGLHSAATDLAIAEAFRHPADSYPAIFHVHAGVIVGASDTEHAALETGAFPDGATLAIVNEGRIQGAGGEGGFGGSCGVGSTSGLPGGPALALAMDVTLENRVEIWGGGGGGGGGGDSCDEGTCWPTGGGGGGAGTEAGLGGGYHPADPACGVRGGPSVGDGLPGTSETGGGPNYAGGRGGDPGRPGSAGYQHVKYTAAGGAGGAAGAAVLLNGHTATISAGDAEPALLGPVL